jgi:glutaminyl-peptide cyclotransferase
VSGLLLAFAPRQVRTLAVVLLALASLGLTACPQPDDGPPARLVPLEFPEFDAERAFALLEQQVAFGPRVPGTEGHRRQLEWMEEFLRERADTVELQPFIHVTGDGRRIPMANVIARFRPTMRERILLGAHWDTRPTADEEPDPALRDRPIPGANDGASGVAVLLELADVLSRHSPPVGVDLVLFDGEDWAPGEMFLGSTHFAANLPPGYRPMYAVVVDMVADRHNPVFPVEQYSWEYAPDVVDRVWTLAEDIGQGRYFPRRAGPSIEDDHIPLNRAGIPAIVMIDFEYGPGNRYWHTLDDDVPNTSPEGLGAVGTVLSALIAQGG